MSHPTAESCPEHGDYFVVPLDPEDEEERPTSQEMTHRCAACGRQLARARSACTDHAGAW